MVVFQPCVTARAIAAIPSYCSGAFGITFKVMSDKGHYTEQNTKGKEGKNTSKRGDGENVFVS